MVKLNLDMIQESSLDYKKKIQVKETHNEYNKLKPISSFPLNSPSIPSSDSNHIILRDYQQNIVDKILNNNSNNIIGIQMPTGSGKSYVIASIVKQYLKQNQRSLIIVPTNILITQLEKSFKNMDVKCKSIMGKQATIKNILEKQHKNINTITDIEYERLEEQYKKMLAIANKSKVLITNFTMYIEGIVDSSNFDNIIIDEAQLFRNFYSQSSREMSEINWKYIFAKPKEMDLEYKDYSGLSDVEKSFLYQLFKNNKDQALKAIKDSGKDYYGYKYHETQQQKLDDLKQLYQIINSMESFNSSDFKYRLSRIISSNYIDSSLTELAGLQERANSICGYMLSPHIDPIIDKRIILSSATLDSYTLNFFKYNNTVKFNIYKVFLSEFRSENSMQDSSINLVEVNNEYNFLQNIEDYIEKNKDKDFKHILILSTSNKNVFDIRKKSIKGIIKIGDNQYHLCTDVKQYKEYPSDSYKIIIGSNGLFQGLDISDLDSVFLNKIPFSKYDEMFKKRCEIYTKDTGENSWIGVTIPETMNIILQCAGRLWRSPDSKGNFIIFGNKGQFDKFKWITSGFRNIYGDLPIVKSHL